MGRQLRRVPLDFAQPLNKVWPGFLMPRELEIAKCAACGGTGITSDYRWLESAVGIIMVSGQDPRREVIHPWLRNLSHANAFERPGQPSVDLASGLAGRDLAEDNFGWTSGDLRRALARIVYAAGLDPDTWGYCPDCNGQGESPTPEQIAAREAWQPTEPPTGDGWQLWETVSEGSPVSPVFECPEDLARWMSDPLRRDYERTTYEAALAFLHGSGWAPSMAMIPGRGMVGGVQLVGEHELSKQNSAPQAPAAA